MPNQIVQVNVSVTSGALPSNLQQTGALISQGQTTLAANVRSLITQPADLTPLLVAPLAVATISWSGGVVTVTTTSPLPPWLTSGSKFPTTLAGFTPTGYNGQYEATVTGTSSFTYPLAVNPGIESILGTYTITDELVAMVNTFFAQGSFQSVYVLELGDNSVAANIANLETYINNNPGFFYAYLLPRVWDTTSSALSALLAMIALFEATTSKTYFFITTTLSTYTNYSALMKDVITLIEAPAALLTEFGAAALFWKALSYRPSGTNRVTPFAFSFLFGVTPYPVQGNGPLFSTLKAANVNIIGTGAEGGLTNTIVFWGTTMDGKDFTFWYSVDFAQINLDLAISNEIINGSNNPINPLYYNQAGINRLQSVAAGVIQQAITDGLAIGGIELTELAPTDFITQLDSGAFAGNDVVNAIPFLTYTQANPSDYAIGTYAGLSAVYIPSRGFITIIFNLDVTQFLSQ